MLYTYTCIMIVSLRRSAGSPTSERFPVNVESCSIGDVIRYVFTCVQLTGIVLPEKYMKSSVTIISAASTAVSAICPQLGGQSQCCADSFFTDARMKLFGDLRDGLVKQSSPQIGVFHTIAMELNNCKSPCTHVYTTIVS